MADGWVMGLSGWLLVLVVVCGIRNGLGDISLTMEKTLTGVKGESVVIPCTYTASNNEEVVKIEWNFKSDPVIFRAESQDHISLVKYRDRVVLSSSPAGDVSLTLRKLDMGDRGNFKCKVTGRDGSGKLITKEDVTILNVIRKKTDTSDEESATMGDYDLPRPATEKPKVTTAEAKVTTKIITTVTPDVKDITSGEEPFTDDTESCSDELIEENKEIITRKNSHIVTENIVTEATDMEVETTALRDVTTKNIVTEATDMEVETSAWRDITTKIPLTTKPDVKVTNSGGDADTTTGDSSVQDDSAIVRTKQPRKFHSSTVLINTFHSNDMHNEPAAEAFKGSGITFYMLIIGLLCLISAFILTAVLIARRKRRKNITYSMPTMNQLAMNLGEPSCGGGGCSSAVERASNHYEPSFPVSEYQSLPVSSNEYEQLVLPDPGGKDFHCQASQDCAQPV